MENIQVEGLRKSLRGLEGCNVRPFTECEDKKLEMFFSVV